MENKQHKTALLQKIQTKSVVPSAAPVQESRFCSGVCRQHGSCAIISYHLARKKCKAVSPSYPYTEPQGTWGLPRREGATPRRSTHRATRQPFPGLATCKGWAAAMAGECCRAVPPGPPAAGWGEVLVPTHRWTELFEGRCQERDREE